VSLTTVRKLKTRISTLDALLFTALLWFLAKFVRYVFPTLFDSLQVTYDVSATALGWAFTAFMIAYAFMQFPSGVFADRFGSVRVITAGGVMTSTGALVLFIDLPFAIFILFMIVIGIGTGVHKTVAVRLLSKTYPDRTGRVLGIFDTFGTFAGAFAPAAVIAVAVLPANRPSWHLLFLLTGALGLVLTAGFLFRVPSRLRARQATCQSEPTVEDADQSDKNISWRSYVKLLTNQKFTTFIIVTLCFSFTYNGVVAFLPLYLTREAGLSTATAGLLYSALFIASVAQLASGELSDRVGPLSVITAALLLATISITGFILFTGSGPIILGAAVVCLGIGAHGFRPVRGVYLMKTVPDEIAAGGFGMVRTLLMVAGAIAPGIVGTLSDIAGFQPAFWLLTGSMALGTVLSAWLAITERYK